MRLKSAIVVAAYVRRCHGAGAYAAVRKRGAEEAGAILVKLTLLDGTAQLYQPAPQSIYDEDSSGERRFTPAYDKPVDEAMVEDRIRREIAFDPDLWVVEVEDRDGRHFLTLAS